MDDLEPKVEEIEVAEPKVEAEKVSNEEVVDGFYKGYDIKWLRGEPDHPDYYLVAEYDSLMNKENDNA